MPRLPLQKLRPMQPLSNRPPLKTHAAVSTLQSTVSDMKNVDAIIVSARLSDETSALKKAINNPSTLHYKGITLTPGGYAAGETVWRSARQRAATFQPPSTQFPLNTLTPIR